MARICPDCVIEMRMETVREVNLDVCPACAGIWFDPEELRTLLARDPIVLLDLEERHPPRVTHGPAAEAFRRCPDCSLPLTEYHYLYSSPVVLESCTDCGGFWVEEGELVKMQQWLDKTNAPLTTDEKIRLALAEAAVASEAEVSRQHNLSRFFRMLQQYRPGWFGLLP